MYAKTESIYIFGISGTIVTVEVSILTGWPGISIIGLPDTTIKEAKERVLSAWKLLPIPFPHNKKIIINLSPANIKKSGSHFDLAIFCALLQATIEKPFPRGIIVGELSLDGKVLPVDRHIPIILESKKKGYKYVYLSSEHKEHRMNISDIHAVYFTTVLDIYEYVVGKRTIVPEKIETQIGRSYVSQENEESEDFSSIFGQEHVKRALEIAAAGRHNILLHGPPGSGKTQLAKLFPTILPKLTEKEKSEVLLMSSFIQEVGEKGNIERPFRNPHHTASIAAIIGGGSNPRPGEISLAHNGILFLDEMPEFSSKVIESLRQPLEERTITISRSQGTAVFPANIILIATMNPCPCGYFGSTEGSCTCTPYEIHKYSKRISGPILDRIDMHIHVPKVPISSIISGQVSEKSFSIKQRVQKASEEQMKRNNGIHNSMLTSTSCKRIRIEKEASELAIQSIDTLGLSMRGYYKLIKVARTIADIELRDNIETKDILEAIQYRSTISRN